MPLKVSVVVAVYAIPQRILRESLDCLLRQSCQEAEFILVNDKSPDNYTLGVLEEYAAKDKRFRVINNVENRGLAAVTNIGIEEASGKYFCRIDPDDLVPDNYLETLAAVMDHYDADMVTCAIRDFKDGENIAFQNNIKAERYLKNANIGERKLFRQKFICRLFKREVIGDLRFDENLLRAEDLIFIHQYLVRCKRCVEIDFPGYFYRHGRMCTEQETAMFSAVPRRLPKHFYEEPRITVDAFRDLYGECKTPDERFFVTYMLVRRFMRTVFWNRKGMQYYYEELCRIQNEHFAESVLPTVDKVLPLFAKMLKGLFPAKEMNKLFFFRLQLLRFLFEMRYAGYHMRRIADRIMLKIKHVVW